MAKLVTICTTLPCVVCGERSTVRVNTEQLAAWKRGAHIQVAFPDMTDDDRELLLTGTHPACWETLCPNEDDEHMCITKEHDGFCYDECSHGDKTDLPYMAQS